MLDVLGFSVGVMLVGRFFDVMLRFLSMCECV